VEGLTLSSGACGPVLSRQKREFGESGCSLLESAAGPRADIQNVTRSRFAIMPTNMRAFFLHLSLVHETLSGNSGVQTKRQLPSLRLWRFFWSWLGKCCRKPNYLADFGNSSLCLLFCIVKISLRSLWNEINNEKILKAIEELGAYYKRIMASKDGIYSRMLDEMKLDKN